MRFMNHLCLDAMYMSAELWAEMLESEKVKVKKLEERYAKKMKDYHVSSFVIIM